MNKNEALRQFKEYILPDVIVLYGEKDISAVSEAWGRFTDYLCKEGSITHKQYASWLNPF